MKNSAARTFFALITWLFAFATTLASSSVMNSSAPRQTGTPVVIELFTSEGCSTCPPSDELLARLEEQPFIDGTEVIAIEEHVDYWNHDGWNDPFSSIEWTRRQQNYAAAFKLDGVYTPQMVIDGQEQFIGSRIREVSAAIVTSSRLPKIPVTIAEGVATGERARQFNVAITNLPSFTGGGAKEVWLAITEKGLSSQVNRGENAGKNLHHASIVRWMHRIAVTNGRESASSFSSKATVKLKPSWNLENLRAVAFVQEPRTSRILGAATIRISKLKGTQDGKGSDN